MFSNLRCNRIRIQERSINVYNVTWIFYICFCIFVKYKNWALNVPDYCCIIYESGEYKMKSLQVVWPLTETNKTKSVQVSWVALEELSCLSVRAGGSAGAFGGLWIQSEWSVRGRTGDLADFPHCLNLSFIFFFAVFMLSSSSKRFQTFDTQRPGRTSLFLSLVVRREFLSGAEIKFAHSWAFSMYSSSMCTMHLDMAPICKVTQLPGSSPLK